MIKTIIIAFVAILTLASTNLLASPPTHLIKILPARSERGAQFNAQISRIVAQHFNPLRFREIHAQLILKPDGQPDHILVYLFRIGYHRVKMAALYVDPKLNVIGENANYRIQATDVVQQNWLHGLNAQCPDPTVQFIAFAPNDDDLEQQVTVGVGNFAEAHGLKTVMLLKQDATSQHYLDYMSCPNLVGNFYDGDADPTLITTVDGMISADEISTVLKGAFRGHVTNIWLACEAFNDPMKTAMIGVALSQRYYAGINDLEVGPSDQAAACTMEGGIAGQALSTAFGACYQQYDNPADQWGFGGVGTDFFGK